MLDSFAVLAYLQSERGADYVGELLRDARQARSTLYMHEINLGEVYYLVFRREGEETANYLLAQVRAYPVTFVKDLSTRLLLTAARFKGTYPISYADAFAAATAHLYHARLVSGDSDFQCLASDKLIDLVWPVH